MAATVSWNKSPYMKEWMAQADPPKEARTFERMTGWPQLFFSDKMAHYFIEWTTQNGILKKIYDTYKKFDASNRSS